MDTLYAKEELLAMLRKVRTLAWIGYADGRSEQDYSDVLREILKVTVWIGND